MIENGTLLAGRYRLLEQIDSGGTSYIFRARDEMTDGIVAVKILKPELTDNEEFVVRFKKEVQASLKLRHANIIRAYDAGLDGGMYYIVMELIEGKTLKHLININGPLPIKYVVNVAKKLCLALEYAHVKGFVHRDIKPHNVMIDMTGEPYIADFGIARNLEQNTITLEEDNVMGSVHYFSPEQARGERADKRSDLYSLGILMYEMLAGHVPFDADTSVAIALKHINEMMPDITEEAPEVPESIKKIIMKATQKDKHFRYKSAFTMYEDLQRCLAEPEGEYVKYTESKRVRQRSEETQRRSSRKNANRLFVTIGISVGVVAVVILIIAFFLNRSIQKEIAVPELVGMTRAVAEETLDEDKLEANITEEYSNQPEGTVTAQDPQPGKEVLAGSTVNVTVSIGRGAEAMPNVTGKSLEDAKAILSEAGIVVEREIPILEGDASVGFVTEQFPLPGEPVPESGGVVLSVKKSPDEIKTRVPVITGETLSSALNMLAEKGFYTFYIWEKESDLPPGTVILQTPHADEEYAVNEPVRLEVSKFHSTPYAYTGSVSVDVPQDKTMVTIAIEDTFDGKRVYYIMMEQTEPAGERDIQPGGTLYFDSEEDQLIKQMAVFVGNEMKSRSVALEKAEEG